MPYISVILVYLEWWPIEKKIPWIVFEYGVTALTDTEDMVFVKFLEVCCPRRASKFIAFYWTALIGHAGFIKYK